MNSYNANQFYYSASSTSTSTWPSSVGPSCPRPSSSPNRVPRHSQYDTMNRSVPLTSNATSVSSSCAGPSRAHVSHTSRESRRHQPYRNHLVDNHTENDSFSINSAQQAPQMPQTAGDLYECQGNYGGSLSSSRHRQELDNVALATITNNIFYSEAYHSRIQAQTLNAASPQIEAHPIGPLDELYEPAYAVAGISASYSRLEDQCFNFDAYEAVAQAEITGVSVHVQHEEQLFTGDSEGFYYNLPDPALVENPWHFEVFDDITWAAAPAAGPSSAPVQTVPQFSPPLAHHYFETNNNTISTPAAFPSTAPIQPHLRASSPPPTHHHCAISEVHFVAHVHAIPAPTTSCVSPPEAESSIERPRKRSTWAPPAGTPQIPCEWDSCGESIFCHPRSVADHIQEKHLRDDGVTDKKDQVKQCKWGRCASKGYKLESLKRHMAGHLKTAEAVCPHCGQILSRVDARKRHVNTCRKR